MVNWREEASAEQIDLIEAYMDEIEQKYAAWTRYYPVREDFEFRQLIIEGRMGWRNHADLLWGKPSNKNKPPEKEPEET